jgi:hypothetical protein
LRVFTHHWTARSIAFEEFFDFEANERVRRPVPVHNVEWTQQLDVFPDGIVIQDVCTQDAGNPGATRVYNAPKMPKPTERPELKGTM